MNKLEVGMYVRGKYYSYKGKIGKIIKNYNGDLEIAYKDSIVKTTVSSFIDDNFDINGKQYVASHNPIDLIEVGDYVNGLRVYGVTEYGLEVYMFGDCKETLHENEIETIVTKEQFKSMEYRLGDK